MARTILIFDFDGTLADTMPALVDVVVAAFGDYLTDKRRSAREQMMELVHLPPRQMIQAFVDLTGWPPARVQASIGSLAASLPAVLFPEVPTVLASLKRSGYIVVISSTTPHDALGDRLEKVGLTDQCDFALGTNVDAGITKEDHPRLTAERLGLQAEDFAATGVFVADLPSDMQFARKAGLLAIGRRTGANADSLTEAGAQHVIANLNELEPLLNRLAGTAVA